MLVVVVVVDNDDATVAGSFIDVGCGLVEVAADGGVVVEK